MTRRARYADTATAGRFPLTPGRPLVHRRQNGRWGFTCDCLSHADHRGARSTAAYNWDSWQHALRDAMDHVAYEHKTRAQLEVESLESLYALPATAGTQWPA